jgi:hypothetical protein
MELCSSEICNDPLIVVKAPSVIALGLGKKPVCVSLHVASSADRSSLLCKGSCHVDHNLPSLRFIRRRRPGRSDARGGGPAALRNQRHFKQFRHLVRRRKTANVVPLRKDGASREAGSKVEGAAIGAAIGATAATAASLITMLAIPGVGAVVGAGWLAALLGSMAVGGAAGGLLGALTNAGISEKDAQVMVEGVRRGGTLVAARVPQSGLPRMEAIMDRTAVKLDERRDLYRKSGWQSFDPNAVPYTADQVRCERALHAH